jgi:hypothetical protein
MSSRDAIGYFFALFFFATLFFGAAAERGTRQWWQNVKLWGFAAVQFEHLTSAGVLELLIRSAYARDRRQANSIAPGRSTHLPSVPSQIAST